MRWAFQEEDLFNSWRWAESPANPSQFAAQIPWNREHNSEHRCPTFAHSRRSPAALRGSTARPVPFCRAGGVQLTGNSAPRIREAFRASRWLSGGRPSLARGPGHWPRGAKFRCRTRCSEARACGIAYRGQPPRKPARRPGRVLRELLDRPCSVALGGQNLCCCLADVGMLFRAAGT
jgi:hypothetical protein